ncbi:MAG TPA: CHAT domain-containing protein, partial [Anaerolineae bacterium]|nr:CHAT domain-containing protein [Anaerolineae bacterium]
MMGWDFGAYMMNKLEIEIGWPSGEEVDLYPVRLRATMAGSRQTSVIGEGMFQFDGVLQMNLSLVAGEPVAYGEQLGRALFTATVAEAWWRARGLAGELRVQLIVRPIALLSIHWEWLAAPLGTGGVAWRSLRWEQSTPFAIQLETARTGQALVAKEGVRVLVVAASPAADSPFEIAPFAAGEMAAVVAEVVGAERTTILASGGGEQPTLTRMMQLLAQERFTILHLILHGTLPLSGAEGILYFVDEHGLVEPVAASTLRAELDKLRPGHRPTMIFLAACEGSATLTDEERQKVWHGVAQTLVIEAGVPAVVAMTAKVKIETIVKLTPPFYQALWATGAVDEALGVATAGMSGADFLVPMVYVREEGEWVWREEGERGDRLGVADLPVAEVPAVGVLPQPHRLDLRPNPLFGGRDEALRLVAENFRGRAEGQKVVVVTGVGGVGKTQLVVEFAHRYGAYFEGGVFWVSLGQAAGIEAELVACGEAMGLSLVGMTVAEKVAAVRAAWADGRERLLIFDHCPDEATLAAWMPVTGACRLLVTSRDGHWGAETGVVALPLGMLARGESVALLRRLAGRLDEAGAAMVAAELGDLPLALQLAGGFLSRFETVTAADYVAQLGAMDVLNHPSLQGKWAAGSVTKHEVDVSKTFALSYEQLAAGDEGEERGRALLWRASLLAPGVVIGWDVWSACWGEVAAGDVMAGLWREQGRARLVDLGLVMREEGGWVVPRLVGVFGQKMMGAAEGVVR